MDRYLRIENVGMTFETRKGSFVALERIDLTMSKGEFVSLIGHSGCGKSTLLNLVAGPAAADRGRHPARRARDRRARARTAAWCSRTTRCCPG